MRLKPHETHHHFTGPQGYLESIVSKPHDYRAWALVCHPHPLQQGTMHNKVVTTLCRCFDAIGIASVRFNYRGVGQSDGQYGEIVGECQDAMAVLQSMGEGPWWYAGFSFGSYVAAHVGCRDPKALGIISVAPPIERMPFAELPETSCPWWVLHGEQDEVACPKAAQAFVEGRKGIVWQSFANTGHFFHGQLVALQQTVLSDIRSQQDT